MGPQSRTIPKHRAIFMGQRTASRHDQAARLAVGERGPPRETARVGVAAELPVVEDVTMKAGQDRAAQQTLTPPAAHWCAFIPLSDIVSKW